MVHENEVVSHRVDEQLSNEIVSIANKMDDHLSDLEKIIKEGQAQNNIDKEHATLEAEINALLNKVTSEHILTDEARIAMHNLQERIRTSSDVAQEAEEKSFENSTTAQKVKYLVDKYKLPASIAVGAGKALWEIQQDVRKRKGFWNKTRGVIKGFFSGVLWGGITYLGGTAASYIAGLIQGMDPRNRAKDAKKKIAGWRDNLFRKTGERYDPNNQEVQDARHDSDVETPGLEGPQLRMDELHRPVFGWKDGRTEMAVLPNDIVLPEVYRKDQVDALYADPTFTDKYLLFVTSVNMWTQAARAKDQAGGLFSKKDSERGSIQLREQELLDIQQHVQAGRSKGEILEEMKITLEKIQEFEQKQKGVIGSEWSQIVMPQILNYTASGNAREQTYEDAQIVIYDGFRKTGGITYGNSEVAKRQLYEDLSRRAKYEHVDDLFEGETGDNIFDALAKISPESSSDEELASIVGKHLKEHGFLADMSANHSGLNESVISQLTHDLIRTYHQSKQQINNNLSGFKTYFTRAYGFEIDTDKGQQQKMITAYEGMYGVDILTAYAQKKGFSYAENQWKVVRDFAWDMMKENALHGAVVSSYQDIFFDAYLPTQRIVSGTKTVSGGVGGQGVQNADYAYTDKKEELLAKIIGAGSKISDATINTAIDAGINIAVSLIPVVGVEVAATRIVGTLAVRGLLAGGTRALVTKMGLRAVLGHIAMTSFVGITNNVPASEVLENLTDWREFAQNAIFFSVLGQVGPWITKNIGRIPKMGKVDPSKLEQLSTFRSGRLAMMTVGGVAETAVLETTRSICDPNFEWNWSEVITVLMLSTIMAGKIGTDAKKYTATKTPDGKVKLVPKSSLSVAAKLESRETSAKTLRGKFEERLSNTKDAETIIMGETVMKTIKNGTTSYTIKGQVQSFASAKAVVEHLKLARLGPKPTAQQIQALWAEDLGARIEHMIASGKTFTKGKEIYKFEVDEQGVVQVMKRGPKGFAKLTEQEILALSQADLQLADNVSKKLLGRMQGSKESMQDLLDKGKISKQEFADWCKTHEISRVENMLVGDFFKLIGEKKLGKLLLGNVANFKGLTINQALIPTRTVRRLIWTGKNASTLFNSSSILYGGLIGDNGDTGRDEAAENYLLYSVVGRGVLGKVLLGYLDATDVFI